MLLPARVEGGSDQWFLHRDAARPRRAAGQALLAPFDPLVWERKRLERLFGMRYRIGIYTPAAQRVDGYYVLPFLEDSQLTARVDLKADRAAGVLRVQSAHAEASLTEDTPARLAAELRGDGAVARARGGDGRGQGRAFTRAAGGGRHFLKHVPIKLGTWSPLRFSW